VPLLSCRCAMSRAWTWHLGRLRRRAGDMESCCRETEVRSEQQHPTAALTQRSADKQLCSNSSRCSSRSCAACPICAACGHSDGCLNQAFLSSSMQCLQQQCCCGTCRPTLHALRQPAMVCGRRWTTADCLACLPSFYCLSCRLQHAGCI
jgi:hypothetical protein